MITKELMDRFLKNECTAEEKERIVDYFKKHPELEDIYLPESEVEELSAGKYLDPELSEQLLRNVQRKTYKKFSLYRVMKRGMAAAAFIILISGAWFYFNDRQKEPAAPVTADTNVKEKYSWVHKVNDTKKKFSLDLPDGSTVELSPGADIKYAEPFITNDQRAVHLNGEAFFYIAKNKQYPFKVFSGEIVSTVLGTSFRVLNREEDQDIIVQLHSGKLLVEPVNGQNAQWEKPVYLSPGSEVLYNKEKMLVSVQAFYKANKVLAKEEGKVVAPQWYKFEGQLLSEVFEQLGQYYNVEIDYIPAEIKDRYFAGKFNNNDSFIQILDDIALLNNLTISKQPDRYIMRKQVEQSVR